MFVRLKVVALCLVISLLAACGAGEDASQKPASSGQGGAAVGTVLIEQGPVADATVTVKAYDGQSVGAAKTNAQGVYNLPSSLAGPFMAEAQLPDGKKLYSVGSTSNMNITRLGDYLLKLWFQARGREAAAIFSSSNSNSVLPVVQELNVLANQIISVPTYALGKVPVDLFGSEMSPTLAMILKATKISGNGQIDINIADVNFNGSYNLKQPTAKQGAVLFEGTEETSSDKVPQTKGMIAASVTGARSSGVQLAAAPMVQSAAGSSNEHWMKDNWEYIKDKKLSELVIPGTHDSGTYAFSAGIGTGVNTAKTQNVSIGDQLRDGIRYFDLRVKEVRHSGCADPSTLWINHGMFDSYRLQVALDEIRSFLDKKGNENEIVVLDFQETLMHDYVKVPGAWPWSDISYGPDTGGLGVLFGLVQDKLGEFLGKKTDKSFQFQNSKLNDLVGDGRRVLVLMPHGVYNRAQNQDVNRCSGKDIRGESFNDRTLQLLSKYDEDHARNFLGIREYVIDAQLNPVNQNTDSYKSYKEFGDKLRVLQLVARPSDLWYAGAVAAPSGYPYDLLTYGMVNINAPLNYKASVADDLLQQVNIDINCKEGALGKRLRMGLEAGSANWQPPNIIIADNYQSWSPYYNQFYQWVFPDYKNGKWVEDFSGSYVDMIIALNRIKRSNRLSGVTDMQDGQCLQ